MNSVIVKKRYFLVIILFLLLGVVSCAGTAVGESEDSAASQAEPAAEVASEEEEAEAASPAKTQINWVGHWLGEDKRETLVREVAQEFAFLNQDVEVNLQFHQDVLDADSRNDYRMGELIAESIRTGNIEWDIVWMDPTIYAVVAEELGDPNWGQKHLVDFAAIPGFTETQKPFVIEDPGFASLTGGTIVGPYIEGFFAALFYNADVAEQMGLEIKPEGMTFEDFLGYVAAVDAYNQANGTNIAAIYEANDWTTTEYLFQNLFKSELNDFTAVKELTTSEEKQAALLKTFQAFEQLGQYDPLIDSQPDNGWFETRDLVLNDEALFYVNGTWMYSHWRGIDEEKTLKMVPVELPVFQEVDYYAGGYIPSFAVMKDAPNAEAAVDLLLYWSTPEVAEKWVRYTKNPTGIQGNLATAGSDLDPYEQYQAAIDRKYGGNVNFSEGVGYILGEENADLTDEFTSLLLQLLHGDITAEAAYDQLIGQMEE